MNVVCYDIRGGYPVMARCPDCRGQLDTRELEYSKESVGRRVPSFLVGAILPFAHTRLSTCTRCGWWAVREYRGEIHSTVHAEDLVMPRRQTGSESADSRGDVESEPWSKVLHDPSCWAKPKRFPLSEAVRLFGPRGRRVWETQASHQRADFGAFVSRRRKKLEENDSAYSLREVAERVGVKASYLSKLERGKKVAVPTVDVMMRLADELHVNLETLLYWGAGELDENLGARLSRLLAQRAGFPMAASDAP